MEPTALDRDFARFRSTDDPEALARVFDASAPELLRIARHLTGDRADAEDVLQSTFLAVIERAETHDPARPALPWMIGILARQAGLVRRKRSSLARLSAAEELDEARAREVESPSRVAERREFAERLGVALAQLPSSTRTLVEAHLFDELAGSVLAARVGVTHGAVRVRLHRALSLLRRMLPALVAAFGLERRADARALARVRGSVFGSDSATVARPVLPIAAVLGVVVLTAAGLAVARNAGERGDETALPRRTSAAARDTILQAESASIAAETFAPQRSLAADAAAPAAEPEAVSFRVGRVAERRTDAPIANAEVALRLATGEVLRVRSDEMGFFRVPTEGSIGTWALAARAEGHAASTNTGETEDELVVLLDPARRVEGVLVRPDGAPAAKAELWLLDEARFLLDRVVVKTDEEGRFAIDGVSCLYGTTFTARSADGEHACTERWLAAGGHDEGRIVLSPVREFDVHVRSRDDGAPIEGASVVLVPWEGEPRPPLRVPLQELEAARIERTDGSGIARCARLSVQCFDVLVTAPGWDVRSTRIDLRDAATSRPIEFELDRAATIDVQVLDSDGVPVPNAFVQCIAASELGGPTNTLLWMGLAWPDEWTRAKHADARGHAVFEHAGTGDVHLFARAPDGTRTQAILTAVQRGERVEHVLRAGPLAVVSVTARSEDVGGFALWTCEGVAFDASGTARVAVQSGVSAPLRVRHGKDTVFTRMIEVQAGGEGAIELALPRLVAHPGRVVDASGAPLPHALISARAPAGWTRDGWEYVPATTSTDGRGGFLVVVPDGVPLEIEVCGDELERRVFDLESQLGADLVVASARGRRGPRHAAEARAPGVQGGAKSP